MMLRGNGGTGYVRVDWFTPDGLSTWGDGRLFILGTEGYIELRKYVDIAGRPGGNHLFIVDRSRRATSTARRRPAVRAAIRDRRRRTAPRRRMTRRRRLLADGTGAEGAEARRRTVMTLKG